MRWHRKHRPLQFDGLKHLFTTEQGEEVVRLLDAKGQLMYTMRYSKSMIEHQFGGGAVASVVYRLRDRKSYDRLVVLFKRLKATALETKGE